jgi:hypothetical protein
MPAKQTTHPIHISQHHKYLFHQFKTKIDRTILLIDWEQKERKDVPVMSVSLQAKRDITQHRAKHLPS